MPTFALEGKCEQILLAWIVWVTKNIPKPEMAGEDQIGDIDQTNGEIYA